MSSAGDRRRWVVAVPDSAWLVAIGLTFVGLVAASVALLYLPGDLHTYSTAVALRDRGVPATATAVREHVDNRGRFGFKVDQVEVTFTPAAAGAVTTRLIGIEERDVDRDEGWAQADRASPLRPPLSVRYLPENPGTVMAAIDLRNRWPANPWRENGVVAAVGLSLIAAPWTAIWLAAVLVRRLSGRRPSAGRHSA